jgi:hypothetical protein
MLGTDMLGMLRLGIERLGIEMLGIEIVGMEMIGILGADRESLELLGSGTSTMIELLLPAL